jgi:threonine/homoserine/homoserine lactone efflux protein
MPTRWRLFIAATAVICATPGPNMLFVMTSSVRSGFRRSLAAMAGCLTGVVLMMAVSSAGVGTLLAAAPRTFAALRAIGALYLAYLGPRMWRAEENSPADAPAVDKNLYRRGLLVSLSNPKAILFAAAFLPQFLDAAARARAAVRGARVDVRGDRGVVLLRLRGGRTKTCAGSLQAGGADVVRPRGRDDLYRLRGAAGFFLSRHGAAAVSGGATQRIVWPNCWSCA